MFQLRATNENGDWGDVREMEIIIEPPFWATWWAYFIYVLLAILFMVLIWWEIRRRLLLRNRRFLQAVACVNRHLDDPDFDVPQFVDEMATSRTTLHKKLKSLTGLNTTGFVRSIRLKAACRMMDENPNFRISELAYKVGFNDPKYFSICFKKEFGMQPTEYSMKSGKNA